MEIRSTKNIFTWLIPTYAYRIKHDRKRIEARCQNINHISFLWNLKAFLIQLFAFQHETLDIEHISSVLTVYALTVQYQEDSNGIHIVEYTVQYVHIFHQSHSFIHSQQREYGNRELASCFFNNNANKADFSPSKNRKQSSSIIPKTHSYFGILPMYKTVYKTHSL